MVEILVAMVRFGIYFEEDSRDGIFLFGLALFQSHSKVAKDPMAVGNF